MPQFICSHCGQSVQGAPLPGETCLACFLGLTEQVKGTPSASSDEAIRAGEAPIQPSRTRTPNTEDQRDEKQKPTLAGCFLTLLCVAVIFGSAVPIVTWRDPDSGLPIPRLIAIFAPFLAGGLCYGVGAAILRILGIPIFVKPPGSTNGDAE
jgi:hypothetical protein